MNEAVSQAGRFRHVVFPDSVGGYGRALNVTPCDDVSNGGRWPGLALDRMVPTACPLSPAAESLLRVLFARAGLNFRHYKAETLARRLPACLRAVRATSAEQARAMVRRNPELAGPALDALLIGVT